MKTTISISKEMAERLKEFGSKGESYTEIILKLYKSARERQLHDLLMDTSNTTPIEDAIANARKKWQK